MQSDGLVSRNSKSLDIRVSTEILWLVINDSRLQERFCIAGFEFTFWSVLWMLWITHHDPGRAGVIGIGQ